ncbi:SOS response-associated peptidase family protein [Brevibacillus choshinensis]|nr:SOS response-associated peptidase family protein [Brevibacillus choshinensis]MED4586732.1 SOS response-associated peptidase family protein [Brevibacillus choshinensis]
MNEPRRGKVHTCTIITTQPNGVVSDIHDGMPVILRE